MSDEDVQQIGKDEAGAALRLNARQVGESGLEYVRSLVGYPGISVHVDQTIEDALALVDQSREVAWVNHPLRYDLAVVVDGRAHFYDVARPGRRA